MSSGGPLLHVLQSRNDAVYSQSTTEFHMYRKMLTKRLKKEKNPVNKDILQAERAWAYGMESKFRMEANPGIKNLRSHIISRLNKACHYADGALSAGADSSDKLQILGYATLIRGSVAVEKHNFAAALSNLSKSRVCMVSLTPKSTEESALLTEQVSQVDSLLEVVAYRVLGDSRKVEIATLAKQQAGADAEFVQVFTSCGGAAESLKVDDKQQNQELTIEWGDFSARVNDPDVAALVRAAQTLTDQFKDEYSKNKGGVFKAYDALLSAWQSAATKIHEKLEGSSSAGNDQQIISTYINWNLLFHRIDRDRTLIHNLNRKKRTLENSRDVIRLYSNVLQSCKELLDLPGIEAAGRTPSLQAVEKYISSQCTLELAHAHMESGSYVAALALVEDAIKELATIDSSLFSKVPEFRYSVKEFEATKTSSASLSVKLHGLCDLIAKQKNARAMEWYVSDNVDKFPNGTADYISTHIANANLKLRPIVMKPTFFDVAYNYIGHDVEAVSEAVSSERSEELKSEAPKGRKLFGLFGRK